MQPTWLKPNMGLGPWQNVSYHRWPKPLPQPRDDPPEEKLVQRILRNRSASAAALGRIASATKVSSEHTGLPCYPRQSPMRPACRSRVATWRAGPRHGSLKVVVKHAYGLEAADINGLSDPFVEVRSAGQKRKTRVVEKTLEPTFDETFTLRGVLDEFVETGLRLQLFDWDPVGSPDSLGEIQLSIHALRTDPHMDCVMKLSTTGFLVFSVTWLPEEDADKASAPSSTLLEPLLERRHPEGRKQTDKLPPVPVLLPSKFDWVSLTYHRKSSLANMELKGTELVSHNALESHAPTRPLRRSSSSMAAVDGARALAPTQHARSVRELTRPASAAYFEPAIFDTF